MRRIPLFALFFVGAGLLAMGSHVGWLFAAAGCAVGIHQILGGACSGAAVSVWCVAGLAAGYAHYELRPAKTPQVVVGEAAKRVTASATVVSFVERTVRGARWVVRLHGRGGARVLAVLKGGHVRLFPGDLVLLRGWLRYPSRPLNEYEFDYGGYLSARGIEGKLDVGYVVHRGVVADAAFFLPRLVAPARFAIEDAIGSSGLPVESRSILSAILLGQQAQIPGYVRDRYSAAGVAHLFAVSGLHLGCLAYLLFALARVPARFFGGTGRPTSTKLGLVASWCGAAMFLALTSAPTSCVRAFIMLSGFYLSKLLNRDYDIWTWLAVSALAILAWRPEAIFEAGFQLSTASVAAIVWTARTVAKRGRLRQLTEQLRARNRVLAVVFSYSAAVAVASAAAFCATLPIVWYHFSTVPLMSVLANLVAVPVVSLCLLPLGLAYVLCLRFLPVANTVAEWTLEHALFIMDAFLGFLCGAADAWCPPWPGILPAGLAGIGLLAALCVTGWKRRSISVALSLLCLVVPHARWWSGGGLVVHQFHVGEGDSTLIRTKQGEIVVIDGGRSGSGRRAILPYLRKKGWTTIDWLFISHGHADHWAGIAEISEELSIHHIVTNGSREANRAAAGIAARTRGTTTVRRARIGDRMHTGGMRLAVLWPPPLKSAVELSENDRSLVLLFMTENVNMLFTGDIQGNRTLEFMDRLKSGERKVLHLDLGVSAAGSEPHNLPELLILKAPHHGHKSNVLCQLLDRVEPDLVLIPSSGRTTCRICLALSGLGKSPPSAVLVTGVDGAVNLVFQ